MSNNPGNGNGKVPHPLTPPEAVVTVAPAPPHHRHPHFLVISEKESLHPAGYIVLLSE